MCWHVLCGGGDGNGGGDNDDDDDNVCMCVRGCVWWVCVGVWVCVCASARARACAWQLLVYCIPRGLGSMSDAAKRIICFVVMVCSSLDWLAHVLEIPFSGRFGQRHDPIVMKSLH